jgi:acyl CoA:acetate/3-ketoacid CoA transferase alpha subunit
MSRKTIMARRFLVSSPNTEQAIRETQSNIQRHRPGMLDERARRLAMRLNGRPAPPPKGERG